jgi:hypothetical protein
MPRFTRTETITHDLGPDGLLTLRTLSGDAHVRTVDGTNVTVVATYEVHGRDDAAREIPPEASPINVRKAPGELEVETRNRTAASSTRSATSRVVEAARPSIGTSSCRAVRRCGCTA